MIDERTDAIIEIQQEMDKKYGYSDLQEESLALNKAVIEFMDKDKVEDVDMGTYRAHLQRSYTRGWNGDKLRALVPKGVWLKITKQTPDPEAIEEAVKRGLLMRKQIQSAYEEKPKAPFLRRFQGKTDDNEEERVAEVLDA